MKNNNSSVWSKFQNKPYDIKFIWYSLFFTLIAIILAATANYLWFKLNGGNEPLKLDGQTFVGVFALAIGLPIAIVGAWAAIRIATLAQETQDRQHALKSKLFLIELTNPIKNNFNQLANSLNELLYAAGHHYEICKAVLLPIVQEENSAWIAEITNNTQHTPFEEANLIVSSDTKAMLIKSEEEIFNKYEDLIKALSDIRNDSKSSFFWNWKIKNDRFFELSRLVKHIISIREIVTSQELLSYLNINKGIADLISYSKLIKKTKPIKYQELENKDIVVMLKKLHLKSVRWEFENPYSFADSAESALREIDICNSLISKETILAWPKYNVSERVKPLSETLLYLIAMLPSTQDVDSFLYNDSGPFKEDIGTKNELSQFLYSFDSSAILSYGIGTLKTELSNSQESYIKIYDKLNTISKEDELKRA